MGAFLSVLLCPTLGLFCSSSPPGEPLPDCRDYDLFKYHSSIWGTSGCTVTKLCGYPVGDDGKCAIVGSYCTQLDDFGEGQTWMDRVKITSADDCSGVFQDGRLFLGSRAGEVGPHTCWPARATMVGTDAACVQTKGLTCAMTMVGDPDPIVYPEDCGPEVDSGPIACADLSFFGPDCILG